MTDPKTLSAGQILVGQFEFPNTHIRSPYIREYIIAAVEDDDVYVWCTGGIHPDKREMAWYSEDNRIPYGNNGSKLYPFTNPGWIQIDALMKLSSKDLEEAYLGHNGERINYKSMNFFKNKFYSMMLYGKYFPIKPHNIPYEFKCVLKQIRAHADLMVSKEKEKSFGKDINININLREDNRLLG